MAQALDCRSDLWRTCRKKRVVAESAIEALRAWNDANELEQCPREESFRELFPHLGDAEALDAIRKRDPSKGHCRWLAKDSNACESIPPGVDGIEAGTVCPHNVYHHNQEVFEHRDGVADTIERLFRLVSAADLGLLVESQMDPLTVQELITAKSELDRQSNERSKRQYEQARLEAESNQEHGR